jgi:hypothetical protein
MVNGSGVPQVYFSTAWTPLALTTATQTLTNKTLSLTGTLSGTMTIDTTTTGSSATISPAPATLAIKLTDAGLTGLSRITTSGAPVSLTLINGTGAPFSILNDIGSSASRRILTGTGGDIVLAADASISLYYDTDVTRWRVLGSTNASGIAGPGGSDDSSIALFDGVTGALLKQLSGGPGVVKIDASNAAAPGAIVNSDVSGSADIAITKIEDLGLGNFMLGTGAGNTTQTTTEVTALLNAFVGDSGSGGTKGLVPAPAAGDAALDYCLLADGTWGDCGGGGGGGDVVGPASATDDAITRFDGTTGKLLQNSSATLDNNGKGTFVGVDSTAAGSWTFNTGATAPLALNKTSTTTSARTLEVNSTLTGNAGTGYGTKNTIAIGTGLTYGERTDFSMLNVVGGAAVGSAKYIAMAANNTTNIGAIHGISIEGPSDGDFTDLDGLWIDMAPGPTVTNTANAIHVTQGRVKLDPVSTGVVLSTSGVIGSEAQLAMTRGGTAKNMTAVNGGVIWSDADSMEVTAAGTSGQILTSGGAATPAWVTSVPIANGGNAGSAIYSANIDCDGGSSKSGESPSGWISSVGNISAGGCTVNITGGIFSATPNCTLQRNDNFGFMYAASVGSTVSTDCLGTNGVTDCSDWDGYLICQGPR